MSEVNGNDILEIGIPEGPLVGKALEAYDWITERAASEKAIAVIKEVWENTEEFNEDLKDHPLDEFIKAVRGYKQRQQFIESLAPLDEPRDYNAFGLGLIPRNAIEQMDDAMRIPVAARGALMPDAHLGYGLPVGGVWGLENAISPNAVGVDIGCRMRLSVYPFAPAEKTIPRLRRVLKQNTYFGQGSGDKERMGHEVFDSDTWDEIPRLNSLKGQARRQLGSSGGGNHFVNICEFKAHEELEGRYGPVLPEGNYTAVLSHSGSRGFGFKVANHYRELAEERCYGLPDDMKKLAWLSMDEDTGREYWKAMNLAGDYASACHEVIHDRISSSLQVEPCLTIEHHHNFCWKEEHNEKKLYVHRKGATPAHNGELGLIPGTMASNAYVVRGKAHDPALQSCSHGAGRTMSRTEAKDTLKNINQYVEERGVELIGAGLDEHPNAYKDIEQVISIQQDLCDVVAELKPRIVRMAND